MPSILSRVVESPYHSLLISQCWIGQQHFYQQTLYCEHIVWSYIFLSWHSLASRNTASAKYQVQSVGRHGVTPQRINRRARHLKMVLGQERDREKAEREARRLGKEESTEDSPQTDAVIEEVPTCQLDRPKLAIFVDFMIWLLRYLLSSVLPHLHLCDIIGLR